MELVRQKPQTNQCGQACLATIAGVTLEEAIAAVGKTGLTRTRDILYGASRLGLKGAARMKRLGENWPEGTAMMRVVNGRRSHWIVWDGRKILDPAAGTFRKLPRYLQEGEARITSYLEFTNG